MQDYKPMSSELLASYAAREAERPELGSFEGGGTANALWIGVGIVCLAVIIYYWLFADPHSHKPGM
jgi:hypothetical protein